MLQICYLYESPGILEVGTFSMYLLSTCSRMQVAYFVNSGSEANDMAMMMARLYTGNYDMLALRNCYHGMSEGTMGVTAHSTWKFNVPQVRSQLDWNECCAAPVDAGEQIAQWQARDRWRSCICAH